MNSLTFFDLKSGGRTYMPVINPNNTVTITLSKQDYTALEKAHTKSLKLQEYNARYYRSKVKKPIIVDQKPEPEARITIIPATTSIPAKNIIKLCTIEPG